MTYKKEQKFRIVFLSDNICYIVKGQSDKIMSTKESVAIN